MKVVSNLKSELNDITEPINLLKEKIKTVADVDSDLIRNVLKFIHDITPSKSEDIVNRTHSKASCQSCVMILTTS